MDADGHMDENTLEVMKEREVERELENERPCLFKSISPVSTIAEAVRHF